MKKLVTSTDAASHTIPEDQKERNAVRFRALIVAATAMSYSGILLAVTNDTQLLSFDALIQLPVIGAAAPGAWVFAVCPWITCILATYLLHTHTEASKGVEFRRSAARLRPKGIIALVWLTLGLSVLEQLWFWARGLRLFSWFVSFPQLCAIAVFWVFFARHCFFGALETRLERIVARTFVSMLCLILISTVPLTRDVFYAANNSHSGNGIGNPRLHASGVAAKIMGRLGITCAINMSHRYLSKYKDGQNGVARLGADVDLNGIEGANLDGRRLRHFQGSYSQAAKSLFSNCDLVGADFQEADIRYADFSFSDCTFVNFAGTLVEGSKFSNSYLPWTKFESASLHNCDFSGAFVRNADFSDAKVDETVDWSGARGRDVKGLPRELTEALAHADKGP